ncbi:MAG: hypothetical protein ACXVCM_10860, partial [Ktedonobacteraceae bacterium]
VRKKVQVIQGVLDAQQMLVATSRTMPNFKQAVIDYNDSIKIQAGELKQNIGIVTPLLNTPTK